MLSWETSCAEELGDRPATDAATIVDMLCATAREHPGRPALVAGARRVDYADFVDRVRSGGAFLRRCGDLADRPVGLFAETSEELITGAWSILCGGGAYLPLSPEYPDQRLRYMIAEAGLRLVLTQDHLAPALARLVPPEVRVVTMSELAAARGAPPPAQAAPDPGQLAYVIYTSGSTGTPKGVMVEHRSIAHQMRWLRAEHGIGPGTVVLQKTPAGFDAAQWEILAPACGATVVAGEPGIHRDPDRIIAALRHHEVTALQCVPTLLNALLDTEELPGCPALRTIFSGGEALSRNLALQLHAAVPGVELVNLYGPTECTINTSSYRVRPEVVADGPRAVSIGRPVPGLRYHILDEDRRDVSVGEVGELHISGPQVARGYLGRPDLTEAAFLPGTAADPEHSRRYRTGDLAYRDAGGHVHFVGRADNQVKLRGFRIELDEIRLAIESHDWVGAAAVVVHPDPQTGFDTMIAFAELDEKEAALMDQGIHGAHHKSKESRVQIRAQLANLGCRPDAELAGRPVVALPGETESAEQRALVFGRKTYRFYDGEPIGRRDLERLLGTDEPPGVAPAIQPYDLDRRALGEILRYLGQYRSPDRLLPKYGYASPGSLYGVQVVLELAGVGEVAPGLYYYHPVRHQLVRVGDATGERVARVHLLGRTPAISAVYRSNVEEVLEFEAGHLIGLLEHVLPRYGLDISAQSHRPELRAGLGGTRDDHYIGTFELTPYGSRPRAAGLDVFVQAHRGKVAGLPDGLYAYAGGKLVRVGAEVIRRRDVIAINQQVYDRASFGIALTRPAGPEWRHYCDLGRALQRLQLHGLALGLGFMASGYSSRSGHPLPAARRLDALLTAAGRPAGPSYFCVGGPVSAEQLGSQDMREDLVHMRGPAEIIRDDLVGLLPEYMLPNKVVVLDKMPLSVNGKIDLRALAALAEQGVDGAEDPFVAPRTPAEQRIAAIWGRRLHRDRVSVHDDFFASGGNSLIAVGLVTELNREFGASLPAQTVFEAPTVEQLARRLDAPARRGAGRLIRLRADGNLPPIFCWPGLGGYPMSLRALARRAGLDRGFYGVQAHGVNAGEEPHAQVAEMAAADIEQIRRRQPSGPYTLWGYSFGARVAFEAACQLEQAGEQVEHLVLIAPGSPRVGAADEASQPTFADETFVRVLYSVFAGELSGAAADACVRASRDEQTFTDFVTASFPGLDAETVRRIVAVAAGRYRHTYTFAELTGRCVNAPVTVCQVQGDDYSFIDDAGSGYSRRPPTVVTLDADHYSVLREPDVGALADAIAVHSHVPNWNQEDVVPHINIKHFPVRLDDQRRDALVAALTAAVGDALGCAENVVSIALEPVDPADWQERVYQPEIVDRAALLCKHPDY